MKRWRQMGHKHDDVITMARVWKGVTERRTTKAFCRWLANHPHLEPPSYLVKCGLLDEKNLKTIHVSTSEADQGGACDIEELFNKKDKVDNEETLTKENDAKDD